MAGTNELIVTAVERFIAEVPPLAKLKLTFGLELRGRGDTQHYRVTVPGPQVSKAVGDDERVRVSIPRSDFNELAIHGKLGDWQEAYDHGHIRVEGDSQIQKLIATVIERQQARARLKKG
jgi:hypothetical protein